MIQNESHTTTASVRAACRHSGNKIGLPGQSHRPELNTKVHFPLKDILPPSAESLDTSALWEISSNAQLEDRKRHTEGKSKLLFELPADILGTK
ncbi:hypothetical protein CesoFtcFv8_008421 [Champsocephalus esox]|uniref:Uncharacterized protein n=2 Tax=Champsocephalus TaxID=52236 RepID=A0AAN8DV30_CHAGU|nr:hypothetical protein CesoFtcFv8_008421 [Champsocephalus esox]KAK5925995.1 hypothetical protein CgunFtcFv8_021602 [Champsocephalus gunnari]